QQVNRAGQEATLRDHHPSASCRMAGFDCAADGVRVHPLPVPDRTELGHQEVPLGEDGRADARQDFGNAVPAPRFGPGGPGTGVTRAGSAGDREDERAAGDRRPEEVAPGDIRGVRHQSVSARKLNAPTPWNSWPPSKISRPSFSSAPKTRYMASTRS